MRGFSLVANILSGRALSLPRKAFAKFLLAYLDNRELQISSKLNHERLIPLQLNKVFLPAGELINLIIDTSKKVEILMDRHEAVILYWIARYCSYREGDMAEVGVYQGGSARIICEAKGDRPLHLFDTFAGHPKVNDIDRPDSYEGRFKTPLEEVKAFLAEYQNVYFYEGIFPVTAGPIDREQFCLVHLDADLYQSTIDSFKFFYPRMNREGIILGHDYLAAGVKKALEEFFKDKPESIMLISENQYLIMKV